MTEKRERESRGMMGESEMAQEESDVQKSRGCFCLPSFGPRGGGLWERLRAAETEERWWAKGFRAVRKAREWSEIVAGPKWKTFIRRFNRTNNRNGKQFQYDPMSYALNFDEGQNGDSEEDGDIGRFSARYASISSGPVVTDKGKDVAL